MPRKTTTGRQAARRSASMRGDTYNRLVAYCKAYGVGMSTVIEVWINEDLDAKGVAVPKAKDIKLTKPRSKADAKINGVGGIHEF